MKMNRSDLEQLICEYIDGELPLPKQGEVQRLIDTNAQAKLIWRDYLLIRRILQESVPAVQPVIPAHFLQNVLQTIDKTIDKPQNNEPLSPSSTWATVLTARLKNPRLISYPLAIVAVTLLLSFYYPSSDSSSPDSDNPDRLAHSAQTTETIKSVQEFAPVPVQLENTDRIAAIDWSETILPIPEIERPERFYVPMSDGNLSRSENTPDIPVMLQGAIRVHCVLTDSTSTKTFFPKFFAGQKIAWSQLTDGSETTVYEIKVSLKHLQELLRQLQEEHTDVIQCSPVDSQTLLSDDQILTVRFAVKTQ